MAGWLGWHLSSGDAKPVLKHSDLCLWCLHLLQGDEQTLAVTGEVIPHPQPCVLLIDSFKQFHEFLLRFYFLWWWHQEIQRFEDSGS